MKTTRYISKCKTCNTFTSALVTETDIRAAKMHAGYPMTQPKPVGLYEIRGSFVLDCKICHAPKYANPVRGTLTLAHECNAKCLSSHGFVCECSCGGKNHGASHAA